MHVIVAQSSLSGPVTRHLPPCFDNKVSRFVRVFSDGYRLEKSACRFNLSLQVI